MQKGIIGKKVGMTQIFDENGKMIPVTVVEAGPCQVVQVKTEANDGYNAVQLGFGDKKANKVNKPEKGHFDKANAGYKKSLMTAIWKLAASSRLMFLQPATSLMFAAQAKVKAIRVLSSVIISTD